MEIMLTKKAHDEMSDYTTDGKSYRVEDRHSSYVGPNKKVEYITIFDDDGDMLILDKDEYEVVKE